MCAHTYCVVQNVQYWCSTSPGAHKTLWGLFMQVSASFSKSGHLDHFGLSKVAKMTIWPEMSTSAVCACVCRYFFWGVILSLPTLWTPKEVRTALETHWECLGIIFGKILSEALKPAKIAVFAEISASKMCDCVCTYLFWDVILSALKV